MQRRSTAPAVATDRLADVDILHGFALIGVFAANPLIFSGYGYMTDAQRALLSTARLDRAFSLLELIFIENKFLGLFASLFGVSFWLFLDRARARGPGAVGFFYRRIGWLIIFCALPLSRAAATASVPALRWAARASARGLPTCGRSAPSGRARPGPGLRRRAPP
jgi:uncharacterized membrane protein YeiB